jgi:hypothetical protein
MSGVCKCLRMYEHALKAQRPSVLNPSRNLHAYMYIHTYICIYIYIYPYIRHLIYTYESHEYTHTHVGIYIKDGGIDDNDVIDPTRWREISAGEAELPATAKIYGLLPFPREGIKIQVGVSMCMHVCMYACMHVPATSKIYGSLLLFLYLCICTCVHMYVSAYVCDT